MPQLHFLLLFPQPQIISLHHKVCHLYWTRVKAAALQKRRRQLFCNNQPLGMHINESAVLPAESYLMWATQTQLWLIRSDIVAKFRIIPTLSIFCALSLKHWRPRFHRERQHKRMKHANMTSSSLQNRKWYSICP